MADYDLPSVGLVQCKFREAFSIGSADIGGGIKQNVTETAPPVWMVDIQTSPIDISDTVLGEWTALLSKLRGGLNNFLTHDHFKPCPIAYPTASASTDIDAAWDGTATVTSRSASGAISLAGLPANYIVSVGDRIGLEEGGRYGYHEVIIGATASGGGAVSVTVSPWIKTGLFTTSATARLWQPKCRFIIDPEYGLDQNPTYGVFSFTGRQRV